MTSFTGKALTVARWLLQVFLILLFLYCLVGIGLFYIDQPTRLGVYADWDSGKLRMFTGGCNNIMITHISRCNAAKECKVISLEKPLPIENGEYGSVVVPAHEWKRLGVKPGDDVTGWFYRFQDTTTEPMD